MSGMKSKWWARAIAGEHGHGVLAGESGDPDIVGGDGAALALELIFDVGVSLKGLTIREQEKDA